MPEKTLSKEYPRFPVGLIGGMSWESSLEYYRIINRLVRDALGSPHSCPCILYSVDFAEYERLQHRGDWSALAEKTAEIGRRLEAAGAGMLLLCTNTMHRVADQVAAAVSVPLLHIAEVTAGAAGRAGIRKTGLLGTRFTMEEEFYRGRLEKAGLEVIVPDGADRETVHRTIYDELIAGIVSPDSRRRLAGVIRRLGERGAEGIILGCTELPLLIRPEDSPLPLFDTTDIHARAAVAAGLETLDPAGQ